jgi:SAM-dependent methyltransferase
MAVSMADRVRPLSSGYHGLVDAGVAYFAEHQPEHPAEIEKLLRNLRVLLGETEQRTVAVVGCGPKPTMIRGLLSKGIDAIGIEPLPGFAKAAREYLLQPDRVMEGTAEDLPFDRKSLDVVVMESVLEHVESPARALSECFRVLKPGGVLYAVTTNRLRFSITGANGEFRVPFFNWFPRLVQEGYVFRQQHYQPALANYSSRPAVHWFTFADLCAHGRQAGFAKFYSLIDLLDDNAPPVQRSRLRKALLPVVKHNPWLRALALSQYGGSIFMVKRPE